MIRLGYLNLDKERVDGSGMVNRESYRTSGKSLFKRLVQVSNIDRILRNVNFRIAVFPEMIARNGAYPHTKMYLNNLGTRVKLEADYTLDDTCAYVKSVRGLFIEVSKVGDDEDYLWTCNLFRKLFGLAERNYRENRK